MCVNIYPICAGTAAFVIFCGSLLFLRFLFRVGQALLLIFSFCLVCNVCDQVCFPFDAVVLPLTLMCALHSIFLCNSILLQIIFMFAVDFELSEFHSPIVSCCGDVLDFVFSPLLLFLHAGAVVTGLICEFSEGACLLAC